MGEVVRKVGLYWISSNENCSAIELGEHGENISRTLTTTEHVDAEDTSLTSKYPLLNHTVACGSGFILFSKKIKYEIDNLVASNVSQDSGRLIETYLENFSVYGLSGYYSGANGEYTMTSYFKNNKPAYTKKNNLWKIWWDNEENKWTLTSTVTNTFKTSTNQPLHGDHVFAHRAGWVGNGQNGSSSHRFYEFWIRGLKDTYVTANGTYRITKTYIHDRPTFKHETLNWMIRWDDEDDRWKLSLYGSADFESTKLGELFNLSFDITAGSWISRDDEHQNGRGPNSPPAATPTPTATATPTETPTPTPTYTLPYHEVTQIAVGPNYSLILRRNGEVEVTGDNSHGNLATGDNITTDQIRKSQLTNIKEVATGDGHSLFLQNSGNLYACGKNDHGQLGDGTTISKTSPVKVADNVLSISCLAASSFYVTSDGKLYGFGYNKGGELGTGQFENAKSPTTITGTYQVGDMIARYDPSSAVQNGTSIGVKNEVSNQVINVKGDSIKDDPVRGKVFDFDNRTKYFNAGDVYDDTFASGTFSISFWVNLRSTLATEYSKRGGMIVSKWYSSDRDRKHNSFIIYANGTLVSSKDNRVSRLLAQGENSYNIPTNKWHHFTYSFDGGKLKVYLNGQPIRNSSPEVVHEFSPSTTYDLVLGQLSHSNTYALNGKLDDFRIFNKAISQSEATAIMNGVELGTPQQTLPSIKKVESGDLHTFLITEDDELWGFGQNKKGQLGDGTKNNAYLPKKLFDKKVTKISAGTFHSILLDKYGDVFATGDNSFGQLGLTSKLGFSKFTNIDKPRSKDIASGSQHSLIVDSKGNLVVTGKNKDGQLGLGNFDERNIFSQAPINNINKIFAGGNASYYVVKDGLIYGSGDNTRFQLADGTQLDRETPVRVGFEVPPTPTPTSTPTPTRTYNEFDTSKTCEISLRYLHRATQNSFKTHTTKLTVNVSPTKQTITRELTTTQIAKGKYAEVKDLEVFTDSTSNISIDIISSELKYSDNWYRLVCTFEIPPINVECELKETNSQGTPVLVEKLWAQSESAETKFGESVAISNRYAIVGAPEDDVGDVQDSGSVYFLKYKVFSEMTPTPTPTKTPSPSPTPTPTATPTPSDATSCKNRKCDAELSPAGEFNNFKNISYTVRGDIYNENKTRVITDGSSQISVSGSKITLSTESPDENFPSNWLFCFFDEKQLFTETVENICLAIECKTKFPVGSLNIGVAIMKNETYYLCGIHGGQETDEIKLTGDKALSLTPSMFSKIYGTGPNLISFQEDGEVLVGLVFSASTSETSRTVEISDLTMCIGGLHSTGEVFSSE